MFRGAMKTQGEGRGRSRASVVDAAERARAEEAAERARAEAAADREAAARDRAEAERLRSEAAAMLAAAATDELTGVWSRRFGLEEIEREVSRAQRERTSLTLAFVDVDKLKQVNDMHGHQAGDELLALIAQVVRAHLRPYDTVVRYGGDEFVCAAPNMSAQEARQRFDSIARVLRLIDPEHSISFGVAEARDGESLHRLIIRADADLLGARASRPEA
jgi:diguanylate cyclase (GGDEF)-like protein